tara:strand:- start:2278 stop:3705 length:1428 start_codon:yes stop_codon:yes gene_type:complete
MKIPGDNLPIPMTTIDDLLEEGDCSEKGYKVFVGNNLGYRIYLMQIPMHEFFEMSEVANDAARDSESVAQRRLDPSHAQKLAGYILKGLVVGAIQRRAEKKEPESVALEAILQRLGRQPYLALQPLVTNIRACSPFGRNIRATRLATESGVTASFEVFLSQQHVLWVVDGQHRRMGMKIVFDFLDYVRRTGTYQKKGSLYPSDSLELSREEVSAWEEVYSGARTFCKVSVEAHLGLTPEQERQLFHDLNNLGKRVDRSLALKFDNSNPINLFIKEVLHESVGLKIIEKDVKEWKDDQGEISWKDAVGVNSILFLNKTNIGGAVPSDVSEKEVIAKQFWEVVMAIPGFGESAAKERTVAAQPVVMKALSKLVYDFAFSKRRQEGAKEQLNILLSSLSDVDFSHGNPMWRYYELTPEERNRFGLDGLSNYLPSAEGGNRDVGSYQGGYMRFGAKHNDIYPIIGDMVRWKLGLPSRHA